MYIAGQYNQIIKFYNAEVLIKDKVEKIHPLILQSRFTAGSYFRMYLPEIISKEIKKIIYLDGDTVVNCDIGDLWMIELGEKILGARHIGNNLTCQKAFSHYRGKDIKNGASFNSGVLLINLEKFGERLSDLENCIKFMYENNQSCGYGVDDQTILNVCFYEDWLKVSMDFNHNPMHGSPVEQISPENKIIHFCMSHMGSQVGYGMNVKDVWNFTFFKYFLKTPWAGEQAVANVYDEIARLSNEQRNVMVRLANILPFRERAFCVTSKYLDKVKKIFSVKEREEIIAFEDNERDKLVDSVKKSQSDKGFSFAESNDKVSSFAIREKNKKIFLIFTDSFGVYDNIKWRLGRVGLKEWDDFFDGTLLLSEQNGLPFNSWPIVKNM